MSQRSGLLARKKVRHRLRFGLITGLIAGSFLLAGNVKALTDPLIYQKPANGTLTATEWNNLLNDFVAYRDGGRVGIGTATPTYNLDVVGTISGKYSVIDGNYYALTNTFATFHHKNLTGAGQYALRQSINGDTYLNAALNRGVWFNINNASKMVIAGNGDVGIGTTTPDYKLDVSGTGRFTQPVLVGTPTAAGHATTKSYVDSTIGGGSGSTVGYWTMNGANINNSNTGNVGIGTTAPGSKLEVVGDVKGNNFIGNLYNFDVRTNNPLPQDVNDSFTSWFSTQGTNYAPSGVGHASGFTVAGYSGLRNRWQMAGDATATPNDYNKWYLRTGSGSTWGVWRQVITDDGAGNVGIGTTNPSEKLDVSGIIKATGGLSVASQFISGSIYSYTNGILVNTDIAVSDNLMIELYIEGNSYSSWGAIGGKVTTYNYVNGGYFVNSSYVTHGISPAEVRVFHHDGFVKFWMPQTSASQTYRFRLGTASVSRKITSIQNLAMPTEGVTNEVVLTPKTVINNSVGIGTAAPGYKLDVSGTGRFTQPVLVGTPTAAGHAATKSYVDSTAVSAAGGGIPAAVNGYTLRASGTSWVANSNLYNDGASIGIGTTNPGGRLDVNGVFRLGELYYSDLKSITLPVGTETWVNLATIPNNGTVRFQIRAGSQNSEEISEVKIFGTYHINQTGITVERQTYNGHLREVRVTGSDGGSKTIYIRIRTDSFSPTLTWRVIESKGAVAINNIEASPSGGLALLVNGNLSINTNVGMNIAGSVGIGTTAPAYKLDVTGTGRFTQPVIVGAPTLDGHAATKNYVDSTIGGGSGSTVGYWTMNGANISNSNTGNVGIGTTNPSSKLHVVAPDGTNIGSYKYNFVLDARDGNVVDGNGLLVKGGADNALGTSFAVQDYSGNTDLMVTGAGNIGIATTAPGYKLDVSGTGRFTQPVLVGTPTAAGHATTKSYVDSAAGGGVAAGTSGQTLRHDGTSWVANSLLYNNGTNVGIGTTVPEGKLHISTTGDTNSLIVNNTSGNVLIGTATDVTAFGGAKLQVKGGVSGPTIWSGRIIAGGTSNVFLMGEIDGRAVLAGHNSGLTAWADLYINPVSNANTYIGNSGGWSPSVKANSTLSVVGSNVGIGTTAPAYKLDVTGTGRFTQPVIVGTPTAAGHATTKSYVDSTAVAAAGGGIPAAVNGYTLRASGTSWVANSNLYNNGANVGIGTVSPIVKLHVNGTAVANSFAGSSGTGEGLHILSPGGAKYSTTASTVTGAIKIVLPQSWTNTMMRMRIDIYEYASSESFSVMVGGYNHASASWANTFAQIIGTKVNRDFTVRFGHDGAKNAIWIGDTNTAWSYPQVVVTDFYAGYANYNVDLWDDGWDIYFDNNFTDDTILATHVDNLVSPWITNSNNVFNLTNNIGIGTTAPAYKLDVSGTGRFTQPVLVGTPTAAGHATTKSYVDSTIGGGSGSTVGYWTMNGTNISNSNTGNVGIGTTNPGRKFVVQTAMGPSSYAAHFMQSGTTVGNSTLLGFAIEAQGWSKGAIGFKRTGSYDTGDLVFLNRSVATDVSSATTENDTKMVITSLGNVGIGTTAPGYKLDVTGTGRFTQPVLVGTPTAAGHATTKSYVDSTAVAAAGGGIPAAVNGYTLRASGTSWVANSNLYNNGTNVGVGTTNPTNKLVLDGVITAEAANVWGGPSLEFRSNNSSTYWGGAKIQVGMNDALGSGNRRGTLRFLTMSDDSPETYLERMRIDEVGNVGIGTTAPAYKLDVTGTGRFTQPVIVGTPTAAGHATTKSYVDSTAVAAAGGGIPAAVNGYTLRASGTSWVANSLLYNNGTNVGIGTTNPQNTLTVAKSGTLSARPGLDFFGTINQAGYENSLYNTARIYSGFNTQGYGTAFLRFATPTGANTWTDVMTLVNGNVGIGATAPAYKLDVSGTGSFSQPVLVGTPTAAGHATTKSYVDSTAVAAAGGGIPAAVNGYTLRASGTSWIANSNLYNNGTNVGIGTTAPVQKLDIAGAIKIANTTATCNIDQTGTIKYDSVSGQSYLCDGTRWLNQKNCGIMTDDEGNTYGTVQIGGQCWMAENINIGTMLPSPTSEPTTTDQVIEKWCYNDSAANCETGGGLYNWNEAMRGSTVPGARGICPTGWHIPTDAEYNQLEKTVLGVIDSSNPQYNCDLNYSGWERCADNSGTATGGTYGVGASLKTVGLGSGVGAGNDLVGFAAKLPGYRNTNGTYYGLGSHLYLWSSTESSSTSAWRRLIYSPYSTVSRGAHIKAYGFSVRCLRD